MASRLDEKHGIRQGVRRKKLQQQRQSMEIVEDFACETNVIFVFFFFVLRNDDIQVFDSKWDRILLSMTRIPLDDILEGLYKLRTRRV